MRAIILAAGYGSRLLPITLHTPKSLLPVRGKALIEHHIINLVNIGVTEIVINLGYLGYKIRHFLGSGRRYGARLLYSEEGTPPLETAGGICQAIALLCDQPTFLVINADIYTDYPLATLVKYAERHQTYGHIVLAQTGDQHIKSKGDFNLDVSGRVTTKLPCPYTFTGISYLSSRLFTNMACGSRKLKDVLMQLIQEKQLSGEVYSGMWHDLGTIAKLKALSVSGVG